MDTGIISNLVTIAVKCVIFI